MNNRVAIIIDANTSPTTNAVGSIDGVDASGTTISNTNNAQNESTGVSSATLAYANNDHTTTDDRGDTLIYDARNRLFEVNNSGGAVLKTFAYDGMGRQITTAAPDTNPTELYYSSDGHVIEEDVGADGASLHSQYVWSQSHQPAERTT